MSKVTQASVLASPEYQRIAAQKKTIARLNVVKTSMAAAAAAIASIDALANKAFATFNPAPGSKTAATLTTAKVAAALPALAKLHSMTAKHHKQAGKNLAILLNSGISGRQALSQFDSLANLQNKLASVIIQAKASLAAEGEDFEEDLIPVDEQGYVVKTPNPSEEIPTPPAATAEDTPTPVDDVVPETVPNNEDTVVAAGGEGEGDADLPDGEGALDLDNLDALVQQLSEEENVTANADAAAATATATPATATALRRATAQPSGKSTTAAEKVASDEAALLSTLAAEITAL